MLFSEVYSAYFNAVAAIITEALESELTVKRMDEIIRERAFSASMLTILPALKNSEWTILDKNLRTPIKRKPKMPLTILQKRWLKAISQDLRIALFDVSLPGLEDIEPLFTPDDFVFFDRYSDCDPFSDTDYITRFKMILTALREKRRLRIEYRNRHNRLMQGRFIPYRLEYSSKDDKFRLETTGGRYAAYINLKRIESCELLEAYDANSIIPPVRRDASVRFLLKNERNALDRVMLHFSDCRKETMRLDNGLYEVQLWYEAQDETEILIRILSFGPMLKVTAPDSFISLMKNRISMQQTFSKQVADSSK
ncbi:WYL domain-containing protein [Acetonema longum]|uniref:Uncharacterized protein n=1 Tax=Acetonema longum DSM 6540 TaxID=1009370 RepID=F7NMP6_9FIRM|nr:WYL domain-containing protein [Acetonema longum]EGO62674.1 hypothetical protein ALO_16886 [Acetonema longum DSM 6540]